MGFDKEYPNRKDWRKPYYRRGAADASCRPHGGCPYCLGSRMHKHDKKMEDGEMDSDLIKASHPLHVIHQLISRGTKKVDEQTNIIPKTAFWTWRELLAELNTIPEEALDDPVQILHSNGDETKTIALKHGIALDTIGNMFENSIRKTRGCMDNKHHPEHFVMLIDSNPFSKYGDTYYTMQNRDDGQIIGVGNHTGKEVDMLGGDE